MSSQYQSSKKGNVSLILLLSVLVVSALVSYIFFRQPGFLTLNKRDVITPVTNQIPDIADDTSDRGDQPNDPDQGGSDKLINSVSIANCELTAIPRVGDPYKIGMLTGNGTEAVVCIKFPKIAVSKSGKYVAVEDISGGLDLWVRIYSVETGKFNTLGIWGTSSLLDMEFINSDKLAVATGYPNNPEEQWLKVYDIDALYKGYPDNVDEQYGYFIFGEKTAYVKELAITAVEGDYFDIRQDASYLMFYGGAGEDQIVRGKFPLNSL